MSPPARQLAALLWACTTALVAFAWHAGMPMDAAALKPRLEQAHSLAEESAMLARQAREGSMPTPVLRRQAGLLLDHVRDATRSLANARVAEHLRGPRDAARPALLDVERALEQLAAGRGADAVALDRARGQLRSQAEALATGP